MDLEYNFSPYSVLLTIKEAQQPMRNSLNEVGDYKSLEFEQLESYIKAAGISCHKQGLFSTFNYFKSDRGFSKER